MKLLESFILAYRSILSNKLRSGLTMLGIIIGVGAVITLVSVGRGAENSISAAYESIGTNVLTIMSTSTEVEGMAAMSPAFSTPTLTMEDAEALERIPGITAIAPTNENYIKVIYGNESKTSTLEGSTPEFLEAFNYNLASGQFISDRHVGSRSMVVVLGSDVVDKLFPDEDPVGKTVKMMDYRFTVIGTMAEKGGSIMGISLDDMVVVPITTCQTRLFPMKTASGEDAVGSINLKVESSEIMDEVAENAEIMLRRQHKLDEDEKDDFSVVSPEQMMEVIGQITGIFAIFLGAIASISLIVGSIGIMNIMLVSVTERTREIGIRKAVGAKRRDILLQFLIEAALLSFVGGAIGIIGGWLLAALITAIDIGGMGLIVTISPDIVILAVSVSIIIGLLSGIYPAMRAARLNPIDALHYE